ncbi:MaoC/PaaZ C-terminal domain-containing protein [Skermania piniformis]|nr:MaoC/PaaZ C-terminal domain-containing protein [Skermania piniformis]
MATHLADPADLFADTTGDHQWIHVDPARAAGGRPACVADVVVRYR